MQSIAGKSEILRVASVLMTQNVILCFCYVVGQTSANVL